MYILKKACTVKKLENSMENLCSEASIYSKKCIQSEESRICKKNAHTEESIYTTKSIYIHLKKVEVHQ